MSVKFRLQELEKLGEDSYVSQPDAALIAGYSYTHFRQKVAPELDVFIENEKRYYRKGDILRYKEQNPKFSKQKMLKEAG